MSTEPSRPSSERVRTNRRARRIGAAFVAVAGAINVVSGLTPPLGSRLRALDDLLPFAVATTSTALVAVAGLVLVLLARGVRRGQRRAWFLAVALLVMSAVGHLAKGLDLEEAAFSLAIAAYLAMRRTSFRVRACVESTRRGLVALASGGALATATGTFVLEVQHRHPRLGLGDALIAVSERMIGLRTIAVAGRFGHLLDAVMLAVGASLIVFAGWLVFGPVVASRFVADHAARRARSIVMAHGGDTLAYFALRDDKQYFFSGQSVVAYAVLNGVALVSPDPIGPVEERDLVWTDFAAFADERGWAVAVMGANEEWLGVYGAHGLRSLYVGDVAIVDVAAFDLSGGKMKGLRQAVNRIAKYGYTIEFHDPAHLGDALRGELRYLMAESRRGDVERGFSMTLGRAFERRDEGLLLAVAFDADHHAVAFCQYVPSAAINGFSLDLMRRSEADGHPNGLTDFVVVRTIEYCRAHGFDRLALNFATMRAVLAGEAGDGMGTRLETWLLGQLGESMQIESLWRYNAKFEPGWQPRYVVYQSPENLLSVALAVAKAESFWELPLIGRFMRPEPADAAA
ncbi:MAG: bifunctional lysylphosphatidylglycerol flippase/synthetase MprF [Acidimicrobiia bacterium]